MNEEIEKTYQSPLVSRYASKEMLYLFSSFHKTVLWRKLWISLAKGQKKLGLSINEEQIKELEQNLEIIDFKKIQKYEKQFKHDVMAHIHAYGDLCPTAKSIIHLGATSCYVTDNADLLQMQEGLQLCIQKLVPSIRQLTNFATQNAHIPCLAFTHFQVAQPTTIGKRSCLWIQDLLIDLEEFQYRLSQLRFLGVKGTTGTQASFLKLFQGDHKKVTTLDHYVTQQMGFSKHFIISGQTYTRKQDSYILDALANLAASIHKFATDIRLLAHKKELEEPFEDSQIGSSAMPYKRNPMLSERLCSLSRALISLADNSKYTHSQQWLERTLDDSANRRIVISEAFLLCDSILNLLNRVSNNLVIYPKVMKKHIDEELPFLATENILMKAVEKGADRQEIHERIRQHSQVTAQLSKQEGIENDLIQRIAKDTKIPLSEIEIENLLEIKEFIGRAPEQVIEFIEKEVSPYLLDYKSIKSFSSPIHV